MNRSFHVAFVLLLLVSALLVGNPLGVSAAGGPPPSTAGGAAPGTTITSYNITCSGFTVSGTSTESSISVSNNIWPNGGVVYPVSGGLYTVTVTFPSPEALGTGIDVQVQGSPSPAGGWDGQLYSYLEEVPCPASYGIAAPKSKGDKPVCPIYLDGRLNNCDIGENAAIYCTPNGSVEVWAIYNSDGFWAFTASPTEIAAVPKKPATNTLIKQGLGARLYRLTSGQLQLSRATDKGRDYSFVFGDCAKPKQP